MGKDRHGRRDECVPTGAAMSFGIRQGYTPRLNPEYFHDVKPDGKTWQPDLIPIAIHLARTSGVKRIIDIGCGRATGLVPYSTEFDIVGVDFGDNHNYCRDTYDWGTWVDCDLEKYIPDVETRDSIIVCADTIEHLVQPDYLLATIMSGLVCAKFALISTPDRERVYGYDQDGPPGNPHHVREWTLNEMTALLESHGLRIAWAGWTRSNNVDVTKNTLLIAATNPHSSYTVGKLDQIFDVEAWNR